MIDTLINIFIFTPFIQFAFLKGDSLFYIGSTCQNIYKSYKINDMRDTALCEMKLLADYLKLSSVINNVVDVSYMQKYLVAVIECNNQCNMRLNSEKCKVLHFYRNNPKASYILRDKLGRIKEIGHSNTERDLGVMIAEDVKWKNHKMYVNHHVVNKGNRMLGLLKKPSKAETLHS